MTSRAAQRIRLDKLNQFLDEYSGVIGTALEVYAEHMRDEAKPLLALYGEIKDDPAKRAEQDKTWITTHGLNHMAGLFNDSADRAGRAAAALAELEEDDDDDTE